MNLQSGYRSWLAVCFLACFVVACSHVSDSEEVLLGKGQEWIAYETRPGPFCGDCYTVKVTVKYNGITFVEEGYWAGDYTDWQDSKRQTQLSVDKVVQFRQHLNEYRPLGELLLIDPDHCESYLTDHSEVIVDWQDAKGNSKLHYNFGCDPETRTSLANALKSALPLLGISNLRHP